MKTTEQKALEIARLLEDGKGRDVKVLVRDIDHVPGIGCRFRHFGSELA